MKVTLPGKLPVAAEVPTEREGTLEMVVEEGDTHFPVYGFLNKCL